MNLPEGYLLQAKKYRLTKAIGQGGFGITYLGVWNTEVKGGLGTMKTKVPVCIKEYFFKDYCYRDKNTQAVKVHSETGEKLFGKFKEKLIEEANILSAVHHPNIVNVLEVFEENNTAYIVMEYIKGNSLKYLLDNEGVLPEYKVIKYTHQVGNALTFVHEKNIVHLDIKPGNILIDQDDNARLIDFGVSKRYDIEEKITSTTTLTLSKGFAAIEQYDEDGMTNFSPAPDIYALGATMYNLLTSVIPIESILRATKKLHPPSAYNSNISSKTEKAILKAMEVMPENRYRTVNALLAAIDAPIYDFIKKKSVESNPIDDETELLGGRESSLPSDDDEGTIMKSSSTTGSRKKTPKRRRATFRRVLLVASILLFAFIGYAVYDHFLSGNTGSQGTTTGINMPDELVTNIKLVNQTDSAVVTEPELSDIETNTTGQSVQNSAVEPANIKPQPQTTPGINSTTTNNQGNTAFQHTVEIEPVTPTLSPAQKANYEKRYEELKQDGRTKMSSGGYEAALIDFQHAAEIADLIEKDLSEIDKLVKDCNEIINGQIIKENLAKYKIIEKFGDLHYVRRIDNERFGAIDDSGNEIIPCEYMNSYLLGNGNREFFKENNRIDVWSKMGEKKESDLPPR